MSSVLGHDGYRQLPPFLRLGSLSSQFHFLLDRTVSFTARTIYFCGFPRYSSKFRHTSLRTLSPTLSSLLLVIPTFTPLRPCHVAASSPKDISSQISYWLVATALGSGPPLSQLFSRNTATQPPQPTFQPPNFVHCGATQKLQLVTLIPLFRQYPPPLPNLDRVLT